MHANEVSHQRQSNHDHQDDADDGHLTDKVIVRPANDSSQITHVAQQIDKFLGQAIAEILVVGIPRQIAERQHRDGRSCRRHCPYCNDAQLAESSLTAEFD